MMQALPHRKCQYVRHPTDLATKGLSEMVGFENSVLAVVSLTWFYMVFIQSQYFEKQ